MVHGECGEIIAVNTSSIKSEDTKEHTGVILDVDGMVVDSDESFCVLLSPSEARSFASKLTQIAEMADNENYQRLTNKYQRYSIDI